MSSLIEKPSGSSAASLHMPLPAFVLGLPILLLSALRWVWVLLVDVFFQPWKAHPQGDMEGPETILFAPLKHKYIYDPKQIKHRPSKQVQTLRFSAKVVDLEDEDKALENAVVEAWQEDPSVSSYHCLDYEFRGKFQTDKFGKVDILTLAPGPLHVPPVAAILKQLGADESVARRPAHIHFWVSAAGYKDLITQVYFDKDMSSFEQLLLDRASAALLLERRKAALSIELKPTANDHEAQLGGSFTFMLLKNKRASSEKQE